MGTSIQRDMKICNWMGWIISGNKYICYHIGHMMNKVYVVRPDVMGYVFDDGTPWGLDCIQIFKEI